jgi:Flp pilus assembly protein TadD
VETKPKRTAAQLARGAKRFLDICEFEACLYLCELAVQEDPHEALSHFVRGLCFDRTGRFEEAAEALMCAAAIAPTDANIQAAYAQALDHAGHLKLARDVYTRALALDPMLVELLLDRAVVSQRLADFKGALTDLNAYMEHRPKSANALVHRGLCHFVAGRRDEANVDFDHAIALDPNQCERIKRLTDGL